MQKKLTSLLIYFIIIFILINFMLNSNILIDTFFNSINLWFYKIFPTMFIFFTISDLLNNYHFPYYLGKILGNLFNKIYKLPKSSAYITFISIISGFPSTAKVISDAIDNNLLNEQEANKLLTMTHFSNPLFIIYAVGINVLKSQKLGIIVLLSHYITNFIIGFLFRNIYLEEKKYQEKEVIYNKSLPFINLLNISFHKTFTTSITVLGIIIFFSLFSKIINTYLNLNSFSNLMLNGLLEITNGFNNLASFNASIKFKAIVATIFLSFGGISIHLQVMSLLLKYQINYYLYFISRCLHAGISALITFIILTNGY